MIPNLLLHQVRKRLRAVSCAALLLANGGYLSYAQGPFVSPCTEDAPAFITSGTSTTGLYSYDPVTGNMTTIKSPLITTGSNLIVNAIGFNKIDNYLWGHLSGTNQIIRIGNDGSTTVYTATGLPSGTYTLGDVSPTGILYLNTASSSAPIYRIDLNAGPSYSATASPVTNTNGILDWAYNPVNGLLYATDATTLYSYNTVTGAYTTVGATWLDGSNAARQIYFDAAGNLYATGNDGTFRITSPSTGNARATVYTTKTTSISTTANDIARCPDATLPAIASQPAFSCTQGSPAYLLKDITSNVTSLFTNNPMTGTDIQVGSSPIIPGTVSRDIQAIGYNAVDNYLWGAREGTNQIVRIGSDGSSQSFVVSGLPAINHQLADISPSGTMYLSAYGSSVTIYAINLSAGPPYTATPGGTANTNGIYDWAYNVADNRLYGTGEGQGHLYSYNPTTGAYLDLGPTGLPLNSTTWNPFFDDSNNLYFAGPNGTYRIDNASASSHTAYQYSVGIASTNLSTDIASCRPKLPNRPAGGGDVAATIGGTPVTIDVTTNDVADASYPATIDLSTVTVTTQPAKGAVSVDPATGRVTYTPNVATFGTDTFTYTVKDNNGVVSAPVTVTLSVTQKPFPCNSDGVIIGNGSLWSFNMVTGVWTQIRSGLGSPNGVGYNVLDNYVYGMDGNGTLARIGADGSINYLNVPGSLDAVQGDISVDGLYYSSIAENMFQIIDLNPSSPNYLTRTTLTITGTIPSGISAGGDFAFSPADGKIYYVGPSRILYRIDPVTAVSTALGTSTGLTSGQTYSSFMDGVGNYYVLDGNGKAFRIASPHTGNVAATLFSSGVATSYGDGARCMQAVLGPSAISDGGNTSCSAIDIDILASDSPGSSDIVLSATRLINPSDNSAVTIVNKPGEGNFSLNTATGIVTFYPAAGFIGTSTVDYVITDGNNLTDTTTVSVTVNCSNAKISGLLLNDGNGLTDNTVNSSALNPVIPAGLYVTLVDKNGAIVGTTPIDVNGYYEFADVNPDLNYSVVLHQTLTGSATSDLPDGWMNIGEAQGTGAGHDGSANGILTGINVPTGTSNIENANFGVNRQPQSDPKSATLASQPLPDQLVPLDESIATVPNLSGSDPEDQPTTGTLEGKTITITSLPTHGELWYADSKIEFGADGVNPVSQANPFVINNLDPSDLAIKLTDTGYSSTSFDYAYVDQAGVTDPTPAIYTLSLPAPVSYTLSGTVFNDGNGLNPTPANTVDGIPMQSASGTPLHANLFTAAGIFVATIPVDGSGNYSFPVSANSDYIVTISTDPAASSSTPATSVALPDGWVNAGENIGLSAGSDGSPNGMLVVSISSTGTTDMNFGLNHQPETDPKSATLASQPLPDHLIPLDGSIATVPNLSGNDPEDQPTTGTLEGKTVAITSLPTDGELWYAGSRIEFGTDGVNPVSQANPFVINNLDPSDLAIKLTGTGYSSTSFDYAYVDQAGVIDLTPATYTLSLPAPESYTLSGTVFNDGNGLNPTPANTVDGTPVQSASGSQLHVNLFTAAGVFVSTIPVDASGQYSFNVDPASSYLVTINSAAATAVSSPTSSVDLPGGWVNTGENLGAGAGNDGVPDGILTVTVGSSDVIDVKFGIERRPDTDTKTATLPSQPSQGQLITLDGSAPSVPVMTGVDAEDQTSVGSLENKMVAITGLPDHGELWYDGVKIEFGGDNASSPSQANPFVIANFDPSKLQVGLVGTGYTSTSFDYAYIDVAGAMDLTAAPYTISWEFPLPVVLISFQARLMENQGILSWSTSSETNSDYFDVERSTDGTQWNTIGLIEAARQSSGIRKYNFTDPEPVSGTAYYRLKMVDSDGSFAYSTIRNLYLDQSGGYAVYPNPVSTHLFLRGFDQQKVSGISIIDSKGVEIYKASSAKPEGINVAGFAAGIYSVVVQTQFGRQALKVVIAR